MGELTLSIKPFISFRNKFPVNQRVSHYPLLLAKKKDTNSLKENGRDFVVSVGQHNGFTDSPRVSKTNSFS